MNTRTGESEETEEEDPDTEEEREREIIMEEPASQEREDNVVVALADWPADAEETNSE